MPANIGQRIQKLRKIAKLTQFELAERVGVSSRHLGRIELGQTDATLDVVDAIAKALDVNPRELFPKSKAFSPLALDAMDSTLEFLSKFQNLPEDAQMMVVVFLESDPVLLRRVSAEYREKWRQLLAQSLEKNQSGLSAVDSRKPLKK